MALGRKTGGRKTGTTNKATADARAAIAMFVAHNTKRMQGWLDAVAEESPEKAFNMVRDLIEYHVPKLNRSELTGKDGAELVPRTIHVHFPRAKA